ncbi:MAG: hypothetical protein Q7T51_02840 [Candidatus Moranbacteria bacterium]|nr:hypothetical protein [Candidatus Moranbacteria bacterium]
MLERTVVPDNKLKKAPEKPKGLEAVSDKLAKYVGGGGFSFTPEEIRARLEAGKPVNADEIAERITNEIQERNRREAIRSLRETLGKLPDSTLDKTN